MTQNVISDIDGATGAVTENGEVVFSALGQEVLACPTLIGGKDWEAGAYSPLTNAMYMPLRNSCARMLATTEGNLRGYALGVRHQLAPGTDQLGSVHAISAETGRTLWIHEQRAATMSLVATGGGLVFGGDVNGRFRAFDQETGDVLWEINLGSPVTGFPISYAVDGRQYVAVSTGSAATASGFVGLTPELRPSAGNTLLRVRAPGRRLNMRYGFLVETYETERLKVLGVWSMFRDEDLPVRPHATDRRGRSVHEQMVHQCVSEDLWFRTMLGIGASVSALPDIESRLDFIKRYATSSAERLDALRSQPESWWEGETRFFDTTRSRAWVVVRRIAHTSHHRGQPQVAVLVQQCRSDLRRRLVQEAFAMQHVEDLLALDLGQGATGRGWAPWSPGSGLLLPTAIERRTGNTEGPTYRRRPQLRSELFRRFHQPFSSSSGFFREISSSVETFFWISITVSACSSFLASRRLSGSSWAMRLSPGVLRPRLAPPFRARPGELASIALPPPGTQARRIHALPPKQRSQLARLGALVGFPHDLPPIRRGEPPPCRLIGNLRVRTLPIRFGRFARNSSRPAGSFRSARFFLLVFGFRHQHRLSSFPPCSIIMDQAGVSPRLARWVGLRSLRSLRPTQRPKAQ